jgi:hypothetical protein
LRSSGSSCGPKYDSRLGYWNEISQTLSLANNLTIPQNARLFAFLNLSFVDDVIAFYDAKYTYNLWRPATAIQAGDSDNNPETAADPNWLPEVGKQLDLVGGCNAVKSPDLELCGRVRS